MTATRTCPQCRQPLPQDAPDSLCPECLMRVAMGSQPEPDGTIALSAKDAADRRLPVDGEPFGGYRIVRALGRGGMGAVYEAEHVESGRRVALKVLSHQLDSPDARARFLREGRLAASINHPNSVYVFGTEEIDGTPVIAMELVAGGTLQERVERHGPLAPAHAVDAVLQIVAGLEAAQAIGILHRDIKPANCFEDADGTVKVGDFGLSISTAGRAETNITVHGAFLGTPAFCSPEQLRGEELNVRSDIYSVGVTLFYLLTGHTPFEGANMVQLLANVIEQPAPSPRKLRPEVPQGLAAAVLRCLAKQAGERFKSYDELRQVLTPFSSDAPVPAPLMLRLVAGITDMVLIAATNALIIMGIFGGQMTAYLTTAGFGAEKFLRLMMFGIVGWTLYYTITEGRWGASIGKAICRLRVIGKDRNPPGFARATVRALIFIVPPMLPYWFLFGTDPHGLLNVNSAWLQWLGSFGYYVLVGLLFSTARRKNGLAAVHDLLSRSRVIRRSIRQVRPALTAAPAAPLQTDATAKVGPYHIIEPIGQTAAGEWLLGYDTRLLRKVWIRVVAPGTPSVRAELRNLGRAGRLRWISGRRVGDENWDAFEGVAGSPLVSLLQAPQPWTSVRFWLLDLAAELAGAERDGTMPVVLALDRVWITADGHAKLLDFPAPGLAEPSPGAPPVTWSHPVLFLSAVARAALSGDSGAARDAAEIRSPLPLHARSFLDQLTRVAGADTVVTLLKPLMQRVAAVSRARRAAAIAGCVAFPLLAAAFGSFGLRMVEIWQRSQPEIGELAQLLNIRATYQMPWFRQQQKVSDDMFAVYIATHYRGTITNTNSWNSLYALSMIGGDKRGFAERAIAGYPNPSEAQIKQAEAALKPFTGAAKMPQFTQKPWFPIMIAGAALAIYVGIPALIAALLFRGGLVLLASGLAVVRKNGLRASRLRVLWRSLVAWAPALSAPLFAGMLGPRLGGLTTALAAIAAVTILAALSLLLPNRGLPDRFAGTTLVPR